MITFKEFVFAEYLHQTPGQERTQSDFALWKETLYTDEWLGLGKEYGEYVKKYTEGAINVSTL